MARRIRPNHETDDNRLALGHHAHMDRNIYGDEHELFRKSLRAIRVTCT